MPSLVNILTVALSALLFHLSTGLGTLWPLTWVAPIPVLLLAFHRPWPSAALVAFTASFLGSISLVEAYGPWAPIITVPAALTFLAATLAARFAARRQTGWLPVFAFPAVLTSCEFLWSQVSPDGTFGSVGYSQADFIWLLQLVSLTGLPGLVFVLTLVPSGAAFAWHRRSVTPLFLALVIFGAAVGYGALRLHDASERAGVRVGLAATDRGLPDVALTTDPAIALGVARAYASRIAYLADRGAEIIVLPEKLVGVSPGATDAVIGVFSNAARGARVMVIVGLSRTGIEPRRNVALVFSPEGELVSEYEKRHLVPVVEGTFARGNIPVSFPGPGGQWGVAICKDLDFPAWSRAYGKRGVLFLAVPAWNVVRDGRLHSRMAVTRGVENGFAMARAAQEGVVTFSDAYGRIGGERSSATEPLLVQSIPAGPGATVYTRLGDWFGWTTLLVLGGVFVRSVGGRSTG
jgi:apolipoprotein N-acyltransferase